MPRECLAIIESKSKVHYSRNKPVVAKVGTNTSTFGISHVVAKLKDMVKALLLDKKGQNQSPAPVKAVEESCVTCGGAHSYRNCPAIDGNVYRDNIQEFISQASAFVNSNSASTSSSGILPSNTIANPRSDLKVITTRSGVSYDGHQIPPPPSFLPRVVEKEPEATKDTVNPTNNESTKDVQPPMVQTETFVIQISEPVNSPISEPVIAPVSASKPNPKASIPYPSRRNDERNREKANNQIEKFYQIFKDMSFGISFADYLILMPKFASTLKALIGNKEKLTLADLSASINLMHLSVWKILSLPDLTPTCMTLELANHSISRSVRVAEDVYVKVGSFHFLADFVVVDFNADPRVPLILGRSFLKTRRALIDVFEGELTLRVGKEAITFNLDQTSRYSANYNNNSINRIDVIEMACEEYSQEVLGFSDVITSGNPTPYYDLIVSTTSLTLTPFRNSDFLLEEVDAFLKDDPTLPEVDQSYFDSEGDILLIEAYLNNDPSPPPQGNYLPQARKELKICEAKSDKSSSNEPPEVELKDLPLHLEYAFLEGDDKLSVIIAKYLRVEEKTTLITVLKSHKRAIAWKLSDIKGINPEFCTHKILMEDDFEPAVQHQRRVNPKIYDVIKQEVIKHLDAGLIYPIFDSPWVSPVHYVPKKGGFIVVKNEDNELIPTSLVTVLGQRQDKHFRPLHYASKTMTEAKSNYTTTEKEMLAVVGNKYILVVVDYLSKWVEAKALPTNDARVVCKFLKNLFARFGTPRAIISDRGTHFYNDQFAKVMQKFGVTYCLATLYHPQTSGQVKVSNRGLKRILERAVGENRVSWSDKIDDALWAFRTAYKTLIGCTPYKLVYEKACHLPIELEHKAYWALKHANFDLKTVGDHWKVQINEQNELYD
uniref:Reverse transcriptase domain-containing protein n=1 Tax=Tanacetum cinerariifolium TaxID=118510 RepID=A0A6L2JJG0_TANCI|nr:reverse transcriptase domain-containing protein [Tanacetum cinerariifolium]